MKPQLVLAAAVLAGSLYAQTPEYGPAKGTLLIQGGGSDVGTGIFETFINLAGGLDAKIVVVPTNGGNRDKDGKLIVYKEEQVLASWKKRGATNVFMLHTADPKVADTVGFAKVLKDAQAVWFVGGRQWNCVDSYANTRPRSPCASLPPTKSSIFSDFSKHSRVENNRFAVYA